MPFKITIITPENKTEINAEKGRILADVLSDNGFPVPAACGRRGTCGKCVVRLIDGAFGGEQPDSNGTIRSCKAVVCSDAVIGTDFKSGIGLTDFSAEPGSHKNACGIAVDIGTTTVAAAFVKADGSVSYASCLNPQSSFGADVISRIESCSGGSLNELAELIRECINNLTSELDPNGEANEIVISGNTAMLHILCGISPESLGVFPFTPQFTEAKKLNGKELGFRVEKVTVLPSVSAFIGGDVAAGIYALGLHRTDKHIVLADLGTNGEIVVSDKGRLYCASAAAGPALEGACIECGVGGINGAVDKVFSEDGEIGYTTIGDEKPIGICGAGLTDAIAVMLVENIIDESGYLPKGRFDICQNVYLTQNDVRQYQLAKSAVFSAVETLKDTVGIKNDDIDRFCIAGGLGYYLNPESAFTSGLLPRLSPEKVKAVGNTSLQGALMCVGNPEAVMEIQEMTGSCTVVDLGGNPSFNERFINNMFFD